MALLDSPLPAASTSASQEVDASRARREDLLSLFFDSVRDYAIVLLDPQGLIVGWNRGAERINGVAEEEMLGRHFACFYPLAEQASGKPARLLQQVQTEGRAGEEGWLVREDGTRFWAHVAITALLDQCRRLQGFGVIISDLTERKQAEAALRESEARYRGLVENANDAIATFTVDGRITSFNRGAERMLGWSREEVIGRSYREFFTPASVALADERTRRFLAGEKLLSTFELEERCKDGRTIVAETRTRPLYNEQGTLIGFQGIQRDITARKQAEAQLCHREQQLAEAQRIGQLGSWEWDIATNTLSWSDELCRIYGQDPQSFVGTYEAFLAAVHPDDRDRTRQIVEQAYQDHRPFAFEHRIVRPDGAVRILHGRGQVVVDAAGAPVRMMGIGQDISEQKAVEEELRRQQEFSAALLQAQSDLGEGVAIVDPQTQRFVYVNAALCQLYGYSAADLFALPSFLALVAPEEQAHVRTRLAQRRQGQLVPNHYELTVCRKDGSRIMIEVTVTQIPGRSNPQVVALIRDITARKQAEEALRQTQAALEERVHERTAALAETNEKLTAALAAQQRITAALQESEARFKAQYQSIPLPTTTWRKVGEDFVLIDYNQAAADLTYGGVARRLGGRAREIHDDDPEFLTGLTQSFTERTVCQQERFQRLKSTGKRKYFNITYAFAPPDLVMVHREDLTTRKQVEDAQRFLFEATAHLVSSLDYETTLAQVAQIVVPFLADWCEVHSLEEGGQIRCLAVAHVDPVKVQWARELQRRYPPSPDVPYGVSQVLRTGKSELFSEIPDALLVDAARGDTELLSILRTVGLSSAMVVPMIARGRVLGAINFVAAESGRHYEAADVALAEELARRAALAVDNARLYREAREVQGVLVQQADALRRSNTELQQFAYVASHDLQEPLRMVTSFVQLLAKRYQGVFDATAEEYIGYAVEGATRMKALIDDLLNFSRVETRGKPFAPLDCARVVQRTLHVLQTVIQERNANIQVDPLPTVLGDELQVGQVFQNLLSNALKFCTTQPQVRISARQKGQQWLFMVQDNGIGIDPQQAERIFVLFQRLHTRAEYPGTGIGLAICKKIIERHGGRVWVESEPGKGATFYFTLPALATNA